MATKLVVCLLIGAVIAFGSGWGSICWYVFVSRPYLGAGHGGLEAAGWPLRPAADWPPPETVQVTRAWGYELRLARASVSWFDERDALYCLTSAASIEGVALVRRPTRSKSIEVFRRRSGWPLLCLQSSWTQTDERMLLGPTGPRLPPVDLLGRGWSSRMYYERGIPWLRTIQGVHFNLPLEPVWGPFVINTASWGMVVWLAHRGLRAIRARRRETCGVCPGCRYPIGVSAVCTECGHPVRSTPTAPS